MKNRLFEFLAYTGVVVLAMGPVTAAQQLASSQLPSAQRGSSSKAGGDGITVHGHWTIDVRNRDGSLATHNEFENALEPAGAVTLAGLLGRQFQAARWQLDLIGQNGACERTSGGGGGQSFVFLGVTGFTYIGLPPVINLTGLINVEAPQLVLGPSVEGMSFEFTPGQPVSFPLQVTDPQMDAIASVGFSSGGGPWTLEGGGNSWTLRLNSSGLMPGVFLTQMFATDVAGNPAGYTILTYVADAGTPVTAGPYPCSAVEPGTPISPDLSNAWFPTLTLSMVMGTLELAGDVVVTSPEPIEQVRSLIVLNNSTVSPFSSRVLATPIQVAVGQRIYVKVAFTFS